jgi:hypothetical protein
VAGLQWWCWPGCADLVPVVVVVEGDVWAICFALWLWRCK